MSTRSSKKSSSVLKPRHRPARPSQRSKNKGNPKKPSLKKPVTRTAGRKRSTATPSDFGLFDTACTGQDCYDIIGLESVSTISPGDNDSAESGSSASEVELIKGEIDAMLSNMRGQGDAFIRTVIRMYNAIIRAIKDLWHNAKQAWVAVLAGFSELVDTWSQETKQQVDKLTTVPVGKMKGLWNTVSTLAKAAWDSTEGIRSAFENLFEYTKTIFIYLGDTIVHMAKKAYKLGVTVVDIILASPTTSRCILSAIRLIIPKLCRYVGDSYYGQVSQGVLDEEYAIIMGTSEEDGFDIRGILASAIGKLGDVSMFALREGAKAFVLSGGARYMISSLTPMLKLTIPSMLVGIPIAGPIMASVTHQIIDIFETVFQEAVVTMLENLVKMVTVYDVLMDLIDTINPINCVSSMYGPHSKISLLLRYLYTVLRFYVTLDSCEGMLDAEGVLPSIKRQDWPELRRIYTDNDNTVPTFLVSPQKNDIRDNHLCDIAWQVFANEYYTHRRHHWQQLEKNSIVFQQRKLKR